MSGVPRSSVFSEVLAGNIWEARKEPEYFYKVFSLT